MIPEDGFTEVLGLMRYAVTPLEMGPMARYFLPKQARTERSVTQ
jgi:hypothetical protein